MKINNLVEKIFSNAVALDQSGGLRNTIYAIRNEIFILNYDHTVLMRFRLSRSEANFEQPISFKANDYDSQEFDEVDGQIVFRSESEGYERKKICGTSDLSPEEIRELYKRYARDDQPRQTIQLTRSVLKLLDEHLSHIEFGGEEGETMKMIQRNIYSGGIIEVREKTGGFFVNKLEQTFGPVAMKTNDFQALFAFEDVLSFDFPSKEKEDFIIVRSVKKKGRMKVIIACCLYDEIIEIKKAQNYGG